MEVSIDGVGRIVVPKPLRDALGLRAGSTVDISRYGAGLQLLPTGPTARLVEESGVLVAAGETVIDDDVVSGLTDGVLSRLGVSGGAVYDALVTLTAVEHGAALATRDARARATYEAVGVRVLVAA